LFLWTDWTFNIDHQQIITKPPKLSYAIIFQYGKFCEKKHHHVPVCRWFTYQAYPAAHQNDLLHQQTALASCQLEQFAKRRKQEKR
jgi:hypothetical protein